MHNNNNMLCGTDGSTIEYVQIPSFSFDSMLKTSAINLCSTGRLALNLTNYVKI